MKPVLDPEFHKRLILEQVRLCAIAGINPAWLHHSMKERCTPAEVAWLDQFRRDPHGNQKGLVLVGADADDRCAVMAAASLRYYLDARVISLNDVLERADEHTMPEPTLLLIPNLFIRVVGRSLPGWKIQIAHDILMKRSIKGQASVVYVEDMMELKQAYGQPFHDFLAHFQVVNK